MRRQLTAGVDVDVDVDDADADPCLMMSRL